MWLLVGGDSEIGAATHQFLKSRGIPSAATTRRKERVAGDRPFLDLASPLDVWEPPPGTTAACIFAAVAGLSECDADPTGSAHINVTQTLKLVERLKTRGIYVLFLSTNQVFDGSMPNVPAEASTCPVSEYGRQKATLEAALRMDMARGTGAAILRLAKVVSPNMPLIRSWIDAFTAGKPVRGFHDMSIAPTPTSLVCAAIAALMEDRASGIYQLTGPRDVTYADVARFIAAYFGTDPMLAEETSARAAGMPEGATPRHTTLDSSTLYERYGLTVPDVWTVVDEIISAPRAGA